ncbi:MAG: hypothetical protein VKM01_02240 [Cyanobacteriota bacterium]|nr:hypothetical protein [Cyanobacteriota bacterium]
MNTRAIGLFLGTLGLMAGTVACGQAPEAGEEGGDPPKEMTQPGGGADEGGEGGEGGEG